MGVTRTWSLRASSSSVSGGEDAAVLAARVGEDGAGLDMGHDDEEEHRHTSTLDYVITTRTGRPSFYATTSICTESSSLRHHVRRTRARAEKDRPLGETTRPRPFEAPRYTVSMMSMS